jgi:hypothetical protein
MKNKNTMMIAAAVLIIVAAAGGFFGGMAYQKNQFSPFGMMGQNDFRQGGGNFAGRSGQNGQGIRPVSGQIVSVGNNTMTVKLNDGSTKIVILSAGTAINKAATASASDLKAGETVAAFGTVNPDGSVTASNIQLNPIQRGGMMGGAPRQ